MQIIVITIQTQILGQQIKISEAQAEAAQLQAFLSTAGSAGIDTPSSRRMTNGALDLYDDLVRRNKKNVVYRNALPRIMKQEYDEALSTAKTQSELKDIESTFARLIDYSTAIYQAGNYSIVFVSNFKLENALANYQKARIVLAKYPQLKLRLYMNEDHVYAISTAPFQNKDDALKTLLELKGINFEGPYIANISAWKTICDGDAEKCVVHVEGILRSRGQHM